MKITAEKFEEATGQSPMHDDLERCNCDKAGTTGHSCCGWCEDHDLPVYMCGCTKDGVIKIATPPGFAVINPIPVKTLQLFITTACNLRCADCFYLDSLGNSFMSMDTYIDTIAMAKAQGFEKVTLLGGEPTLHPNIEEMIVGAKAIDLSVTIYTNGVNLARLQLPDAEIRVGVHGLADCDKPLSGVPDTDAAFTMSVMLNRQNAGDLSKIASVTNERFPQVKKFYISSIKDIAEEGFWGASAGDLHNEEYANVVNDFLRGYTGNFDEIHVSARGVFDVAYPLSTCRFENVFTDGSKCICPLDVGRGPSKRRSTAGPCQFGKNCVLHKLILKRTTK